MVPFMAMSSHDRFVIETPLRPGNVKRERNITLFFAGGVCGSGRYNQVPPHCKNYKQLRYSGGVRQMVRGGLGGGRGGGGGGGPASAGGPWRSLLRTIMTK